MTNKYRLIAFLGFQPSINVAEAALMDAGINMNDTYDSSLANPIKTAAVVVMKVILTTADTGNSVTGFNSRYDRASILKLIGQYESELGLNGVPTIKAVAVW
jgi:hypothetical protein